LVKETITEEFWQKNRKILSGVLRRKGKGKRERKRASEAKKAAESGLRKAGEKTSAAWDEGRKRGRKKKPGKKKKKEKKEKERQNCSIITVLLKKGTSTQRNFVCTDGGGLAGHAPKEMPPDRDRRSPSTA